jgi:pimeloyl-ACP methyl ester carboxylesterase
MTAAQSALNDKALQRDCFREQLRDGLGIQEALQRREVLRIDAEPGIHCELFEYSSTAPVLLFLPGLGTYSELYAELLAGLSDQGFNAVGVDPRGHGYSGGERGYYNIEESVADLQRVLDTLQQRFSGPVVVFGYSGGAVTGLALAEADSRVQALLCGTLLLSELAPDMLHGLGWQWTTASAWMFPRMKVPLKGFIDFETLLAGHPAGPLINVDPMLVFEYPLRTLASLFSRSAGILKRQYPFSLAIMQGTRDEVLDVDYARRVAAQSVHPIELVLIPAEGHMLPWDNAAALAQRAAQWFSGQLQPLAADPA